MNRAQTFEKLVRLAVGGIGGEAANARGLVERYAREWDLTVNVAAGTEVVVLAATKPPGPPHKGRLPNAVTMPLKRLVFDWVAKGFVAFLAGDCWVLVPVAVVRWS